MELKKFPLGVYADTFGGKWLAELVTGSGIQPAVHLRREGLGRLDTYNLSQFLRFSGEESLFTIAGGFIDDVDYTLDADTVRRLASAALSYVSPLDGHYEVRWVPNDPEMPF